MTKTNSKQDGLSDMRTSTQDMVGNTVQKQELPSGIRQLRLPMPFRLDHINVYLLEDENGTVLIDTGLVTKETEEAWLPVLTQLTTDGKPLHRILLTHMHPDHLGMAPWLHRMTGAPIHLSAGEWQTAQSLWQPNAADTKAWQHYLKALGLPPPVHERLLHNPDTYRQLVPELPAKVEALCDSMVFKIGKRTWHAMVGRGHSPEHVCFWNQEERILISGDFILPEITPNIGAMHIGPHNPLQDFMDSLCDFERLNPLWTLPSHGDVIIGPNSRIKELRQHHAEKLERLRHFCDKPRTAFQCTEFLFGKQGHLQQFVFALREALAHLKYLVAAGELGLRDIDGSHWYQTSPSVKPATKSDCV